VASNVFNRMWSDMSSDMRPSVKALLDTPTSKLGPYNTAESRVCV